MPGNLAKAGVSAIQGVYVVSLADLKQSVIQTNANFSVYNSLADYHNSKPYKFVTSFPFSDTSGDFGSVTTSEDNKINVGANTQWGPVFSTLSTGFVGGYWRDTNAENAVQFNNSNFWSYLNADGTYKVFTNPVSNTPEQAFEDVYSQLVATNANTYTGNYTDKLKSGITQGSPLVNVGESGEDYSLDVSLLDIENIPQTNFFSGSVPTTQNEALTKFKDFSWNGYQDPVQPYPSKLKTTSFSSVPPINNNSDFKVEIDFTSGNGLQVLPNKTQIKQISFKSTEKNFDGTPQRFLGWGNYTYKSGSQAPTFTSGSEGIINLINFPLPHEAGVTGYTLKLVGDNGEALYAVQFYLTGDGKPLTSGGQDYYPLANATDFAISIPNVPTPAQNDDYLSSLKLQPNFSNPNIIPPQISDYNPAFTVAQPWAPLVWTSSGTDYSLPGDYFPNGDNPAKITPGPQNITISTEFKTGEVTFSWLGGPNTLADNIKYYLPTSFEEPLAGIVNNIKNIPTNKVFALAQGTIYFTNGPNGVASLKFQADLDGQWAVSTNPVTPLTNGSYTISFKQALTDAEGNLITVGYAGGTIAKNV